MRMPNSHEDDSGASTEDTPVTQGFCSDKMKENDNATQSLQPTGKGTVCEVHYQPSPKDNLEKAKES